MNLPAARAEATAFGAFSSLTRDAADWLLREARDLPDAKSMLGEFCRRLNGSGFALSRLFVSTRTLHPQVLSIGYLWHRGDAQARERPREHGILESPAFLLSPLKAIFDGAPQVRRRLEAPETPMDFPILAELRAEGMTDYVVLPLKFSGGRMNIIAIATDRQGGFSDQELGEFAGLIPLLALVLEIKEVHRMTASLLDTYLGRDVGRRVLGGLVKRGDGITLAAALYY